MGIINRKRKDTTEEAPAAPTQPLPTVAEVDAKIAALNGELARIANEKAQAEDDYILTPDEGTLDRITRLEKQGELTARRRPLLDQEYAAAVHREGLVKFDALCGQVAETRQVKAGKQARLDALYAELKQLEPEFQQASALLAGLENQRTWFAADQLPQGSRQTALNPVKAGLTPLEKAEIEHRHGLKNDEELEGARRDAAGQPPRQLPRQEVLYIGDSRLDPKQESLIVAAEQYLGRLSAARVAELDKIAATLKPGANAADSMTNPDKHFNPFPSLPTVVATED